MQRGGGRSCADRVASSTLGVNGGELHVSTRRTLALVARVPRVAAASGDDPTAVGIDDVVEAKKLSRTPANPRASDLVEHGLDLDVARRESRGNAEESVADFLGLEMSRGPRNECGQLDGPWLTDGHGGRPFA
jgi:hypothetical protein